MTAGRLGTLIAERREQLGLTYRTAAVRAGLTQGAVYKLANNELTWMPKQATLRGLARALELPVTTLVEAVTADLGMSDFMEGDEPNAVTLDITHLTPVQQHAVRTVIESYGVQP